MTSPDGTPRTTFVIVTYNSMSTLERTLGAAKRCYDAGLAKCVVADNTSKDGTPDYIEKEHPWVKLIRTGGNLGFGRGNNRGFEEVDTEYVYFLNPDASCEPDDLRVMIEFMDTHPKCGVAGPAGRMSSGKLHQAGEMPSPEGIVREAVQLDAWATSRPPIEPGTAPFRTDWISGAALMFRSQVYLALGGFDPRFFLYFEETDLLLRVRELGSEVWVVGTSVIDHIGAATTTALKKNMYQGCIAEHYFQSRFYYLVKHFGRRRAYLAEAAELGVLAARALPQLVRRRGHTSLAERLQGPLFEMPPSR